MKFLATTAFVLLVALPLGIIAQQGAPRGAAPAPPPCVQQGNTQYVCGQTAPEDLVLVPGGDWVVASMFGGTGGIQIINTKVKSTVMGYPTATAKEQLDKKTYDTCPGPPDAEQKAMFRTHGLALREGRNSQHTLYVVNHGKRESIEVFTLDAKAKPPALTWIGCAVAPDPIGLNSVLPLPDGGFIGTDFLERGPNAAAARGKMQAGENNGSLWEWHTGTGWKIIPGTETSGANGLELSKDGKTLFVNAWGSRSFYRMQMGQTKRDTVPLGFQADNMRWAKDGSLLVVGQGGTGQMQTTNIVKINPTTLKVTEILKRPNTPEFGAGTVAIEVGKDLWVGSFRGDRLLVVPAP
jgi:hypothetical protein